MSAEEFLNKLQQRRWVDETVITKLRMQVARSRMPVDAETVAKLLVDKGRLTAAQAQELLAQDELLAQPPGEEEELGLADLGDDDLAAEESVSSGSPGGSAAAGDWIDSADELATVTPLPDETAGLTPVEDTSGLRPVPGEAPPAPPPLEEEPVAGHEEGFSEPLDPLGTADAWGDAASLEAMGGAFLPGGIAGAPGTFRGKKVRRNQWESPWWLLLGGGVILLVIIVGFLWFVITRGSAQEMFEAAEESYRKESYSEAIQLYERFLHAFPKDENASKARVKRMLARLRLPVAASSWRRALEVAETDLPEVEQEASFPEARAELRSLLPDIADGFTQYAKNADDTARKQEFVDLAEQAMKLVDNPTYLPASDRTNPAVEKRISTILEELEIQRREIRKEKELVRAVDQIKRAVQDKRTAEAFAIRKALLRKYPSLDANEALREAVLAITEKERDLVEVVSEPLSALATDHQPTIGAAVVLANRTGKTVASAGRRAAVVLVSGAVYGLDVRSGDVLWRRFVGHETTFPPQPVAPQRGADVLVVDARRNALLRLRRADGQLLWRLPLGHPFANPVIMGDHVFVAARSGQLRQVDLETGESSRYARLPLPLCVGPGGDAKQPYLYQTGEHSNLYVLSAADLACREVFYLGHPSGSIVVPPVMTRGHLLIAENAGADYCLLHILVASSRGLKLERPQQPYRLKGHVVLPLVLYGHKVLVVTDRGTIQLYEVNLGYKERPVAKIAEFTATTKEPVISYPLAEEGQLWIADRRFAKYEIQVASGKLLRRWIKNPDDTFVAPLQRYGDVVIHVRRRRGAPGVSVSAVNLNTGDPIWRTDLAVPHAGIPVIAAPQQRAVAVSAQGNLFEIDSSVLRAGRVNQPKARPTATEQLLWFTDATAVGDHGMVFTGFPASNRLLSYDPRRPSGPLRVCTIAAPDGSATAPPVAFDGGLLVPWDNGEVLLVDVETGKPKAVFKPRTRPGQPVNWKRPVVVGAGDRFVIADNQNRIFLVGKHGTPSAALAKLQQATVSSDIISPLVALGDTVCAVARGRHRDYLVSFKLPRLAAGPELPLDAEGKKEKKSAETAGVRLAWGPERIGDAVLLAVDAKGVGKLICLDAGPKIRWTAELKYGALAGRPLQRDGDFILAAQDGTVWRVAGDSGTELGKIQIDEPCGSGAVALGDRLWLAGSDGVLYTIPMISPQ